MNLNNFENHVEPIIISRGADYYRDQAVRELEEFQSGEWIADVEGSDMYRVAVYLKGNEIIDWDCDCPYDMGPICKHVVAVLYAIRQESINEKQMGTAKKSSQKKKEIDRIFEKVSKKDLVEFIRKQIKTSRSFKNIFMAHFADLLEERADQKYRTILINSYKSALGRNQFIDHSRENILLSPIAELSQRANELLSKRFFRESLEICKALIELIPTFIPAMDEDYYSLRDELESAFDNMFGIAESAHPQFKEELFKYCLIEYPKEKYREIGMDGYFLSLLIPLITTESQEKRFFKLIEEEISKLEENGSANSYRIVSLVEARFAYLNLRERTKEAQELIEKYKHFNHFRKMLIEMAIQRKDYDRARTLCLEGIELNKETWHTRQDKIWYDYLLEIAEKSKNVPEIRKITKKLFFDYYYDMEYYRKLKKTYPSEKWPEECEKIIKKINGPQDEGIYLYADILAKIFIEERYYDRLLKLVQLHEEDIRFLSKFAGVLKDKYPGEIIKIYEKSLRDFAQNTGRGNYTELVKYLDELRTVKDGAKKVRELVAHFRNEYRRRPAMMEILNKKFPET